MYYPTLRPSAPKQQGEGSSSTLRWCLLVWAVLRMVMSLFFTGIVLLRLAVDIKQYDSPEDDFVYKRLLFDMFAILVQLVEFGMLVTFITAGVKKNATLYRAYYRYCILTLIIYIVTVILGYVFFFDDDYFLGGAFISFHLVELFLTNVTSDYFYITFFVTIAIDIGLEIFLIVSIKKLIQRYSSPPCENV